MQKEIKKYRLKLTKKDELRFISHLDWQSLILKVFRRTGINLVLSEGFNKMPKVSYSPALPIFIESDCELVNFQTYDNLNESFIELFNSNSPDGAQVTAFFEQNPNEPKSLENYIQWASYRAKFKNHVYNLEQIRYIIEKCLSSGEFLITKKTKKGIDKEVNYRKSLKSLQYEGDELLFTLKAGQNELIPALRADEFLKILFNGAQFSIKRTGFFDVDFEEI